MSGSSNKELYEYKESIIVPEGEKIGIVKPIKIGMHKHDICGLGLAEEKEDLIDIVSEELEEYPEIPNISSDKIDSAHDPDSGTVDLVGLKEWEDNCVPLEDDKNFEIAMLVEDDDDIPDLVDKPNSIKIKPFIIS